MAAKKQLNAEVEYYIQGLSIAVALDKNAKVVWHQGRMVVTTQMATLHIPCNFYASRSVRADELIKAFKGCNTEQYTIAEVGTLLNVSWGRKKAQLETQEAASVYVRALDDYHGINDIDISFTELLRDSLKDLNEGSDPYSKFVQFFGDKVYWTNATSIAQIHARMTLPHLIFHVKDLLRVVAPKDLHINALWWSATGVHATFYYNNGFAIQIATVDTSVVKYPELTHFFDINVDDAIIDLNEDHFDAIEYVGRFADKIIFIEPTFVGTQKDHTKGTSVNTEGLPLSIAVSADVAKLSAFKKADKLIKKASHSRIGFLLQRENVMFCFSAVQEY